MEGCFYNNWYMVNCDLCNYYTTGADFEYLNCKIVTDGKLSITCFGQYLKNVVSRIHSVREKPLL